MLRASMATPGSRSLVRTFRFGAYELDTSGELRKGGSRVRLQNKPFLLLLALVERAGETVTRAELQRRLWPDTHVDFEQSLNIAVKKVRDVLCDTADNPRFVETIPGEGYRFTAIVETLLAGNAAPPVAESLVTAPRHSGGFVWGVAGIFAVVICAATVMVLRRPLPAPTLTVLTTYDGTVFGPQVSPDDTRLAFFWRTSELGYGLYAKVIGSENSVRLAELRDGESAAFAWSPDGTQVALMKQQPGADREIYLLSTLGGEARELTSIRGTSGPGPPTLAWSPDGKTLALSARDSVQERFGILLLDLASLEVKRLTHPSPAEIGDAEVCFSPDGKWLAFNRIHDLVAQDIYTVPVSGGEARRVTSESSNISGLSVSSDANSIVFSSTTVAPNTHSLYQVPVSGGKASLLFMSGDDIVSPRVLHSGRRIVYLQRNPNGTIWRYQLSPRHQAHDGIRIVSSSREQNGARLSPDGKDVVYASDRSGSWNIWISSSDGVTAKQLTFVKSAGSPAWSPDGRRIAFDAFTAGHGDIYVVDVAGGTPLRITDGNGMNLLPGWSHDGKSIYYTSVRADAAQIWQQSLASGRKVQLTARGGTGGREGIDGALYYWRDKAVWRKFPGGKEEFVVQAVFRDAWTLGQRGLYFYDRGSAQPSIEYFDFSTKRQDVVLSPALPPQFAWSISVSEPEDSLVYVARERVGSEIRLVDLH
jgi:Tol biopolymer transport system component/DNA-binding winged helix-turn-helix (wHTH) protein